MFLLGVSTPGASPSSIPVFGSGVVGFSILLTVIVWSPAAWAAVLAVMPNPRGRYDRFFYGSSFWAMAWVLVLSLIGYMQFAPLPAGQQFVEHLPWLPGLGVEYRLGADGVSITLLLLNGLVGVAAVLASHAVRVRPREYFVLLLAVETAVNGAVVASDTFLFALFYGAAALPVALLVLGWGGPRRRSAAYRLLGFWGAGSAVLVLAILMLVAASGNPGFNLAFISHAGISARASVIGTALIVVAAATRLPIFPLHGWARALYTEAPVGVVVIVAGAASRTGAYLVLRMADFTLVDGVRLLAPIVAVLAGLTIVYAALCALRSRGIRQAAAYLAMVPGPLAVIGAFGVTPLSINGAVLVLAGGALAAALVTGAGALAAERAQTADFGLLGGLAARAPWLGWMVLLGFLAALGVPLTISFLGEMLVFFGAFTSSAAGVVLALAGIALAAVAVGWLIHRVLFGAPNPDAPPVTDLSLSDAWALGLLAGALIYFGTIPGGPKLAGVPLFDPGITNVVNAAVSDLAGPYSPPAPPNR